MIVSRPFVTCLLHTKPHSSGANNARVTHLHLHKFKVLSESYEMKAEVAGPLTRLTRINYRKVNLASNLSKYNVNIRRRQHNTSIRASVSSSSVTPLEKDVHYYLNKGLGSIILLLATGVALTFANLAKTAPLYEFFLEQLYRAQNFEFMYDLASLGK